MKKEILSSWKNILSKKNLIKCLFKNKKQLKKIRVGFYVIYPSAFPARSLIYEMLKESHIDIEVVIIATPDIMRGKENTKEQIQNVEKEFKNNQYIKVLSAYDVENEIYVDHSDGLDFACITNPYETMTHEYCRNEFLTNKGIKTFYIHYSYSVTNFDKNVFKMDNFSRFWKVFISNPITLQELGLDKCNTDNFNVIGYPKLDFIKVNENDTDKQKLIILAPHHTFNYEELNLAAFEKFMDIYWMLPEMFPDLEFVFRPHPLWKINLKNVLNWTDTDIDVYLNKILSKKNVSLSSEGDYIELFNKSSALIHDCGSFLAEYLYTEKPCCFLMRNSEIYSKLNYIGKKCLDLHDHAYEIDQVFEFVKKIASNTNTMLDIERTNIINNHIKINNGNSAKKILECIIRS